MDASKPVIKTETGQPTVDSTKPAVEKHAIPGEKIPIGTEPIDKRQPWRDIIGQQTFSEPGFFQESPKGESPSQIRLLQELDTKSR